MCATAGAMFIGSLGGATPASAAGPVLEGLEKLLDNARVLRNDQSVAGAEEKITGEPGSPSAKTTIDGKHLPAPLQKFEGKIEKTTADSKPYWPATIAPKKDAPNVLLIITDDAGFGISSTFGGVIPTPALDRIADSGLRYTNFHSTALCSPTRAAMITGRNHHSVGYGVISEQATGYPGYDSFITKDKATVGRILRDNGYSTAWFGKNHNTPSFQASQSGPFDQWPTGMGFEYFYGFMGGTPTNGSLATWFAIPRRYTPMKETRTTTSRPLWRMRRSAT